MTAAAKIINLDPAHDSFSQRLQEITDKSSARYPIHLTLDTPCKPTQLPELATGAINMSEQALSKLSLKVNCNLLSDAKFNDFLKTLQKNPPRILALSLDESELQVPVLQASLEYIASIANFPIIITNAQTQERVSFKAFEKKIIATIQSSKSHTNNSFTNANANEIAETAPQGPKIRLKALIKKQNQNLKKYTPFIQVQVEHTEIVEQKVEQVVNVNTEEVTEQYQGELVDYAKFNSPKYRQIALQSIHKPQDIHAAFQLAEFELFANLPHAVKYISPAAAEKLASNLPQWVSFNKENAPQFILKKTAKGEYVLDYEVGEEDEHHLLAPQDYSPYDDAKPYYHLNFTSQQLDTWIQNPVIRNELDKANNVPLMNLWIRYGDIGVQQFFDKLNQIDKKHPGLGTFLYQHYFSHFDHLEPFYNDDIFGCFSTLENYSPLQIECLKRFLNSTGSSQHNLVKTIEGFDYFWKQFIELCGNDERLMKQLDTDWRTPKGGQPVVYMERLLTLLKNSRNLPEQLSCLSGIQLDQYGAYYASKYEGFTTVHPAMQFVYEPNKLNAQAFSATFQLYRIELEKLCELAKTTTSLLRKVYCIEDSARAVENGDYTKGKVIPHPDYMSNYDELPPNYQFFWTYQNNWHKYSDNLPISAKKFYTFIHRFMGQQLAGITIPDFVKIFHDHREYLKQSKLTLNGLHDEANFSLPLLLLQSLFLVSTERFKGVAEYRGTTEPTLKLFLEQAQSIVIENMFEEIARLKTLRDHNVKLSDLESIYYSQLQTFSSTQLGVETSRYDFMFGRVAEIQTTEPKYKESCWWAGVIHEFPQRLVDKLITNKYSALKFIHFVGKQEEKRATIYALNTEEYFASLPEISLTFRDNLLLFSAQLNNYEFNIIKSDFLSCVASKTQDAVALEKIRNYLLLASQGNKDNNALHYTFQLLVDSEQFFSYDKVLAVFKAVHELPQKDQYDVEAIHKILTDNKIEPKNIVPALFHRNNENIKGALIEFIAFVEWQKQSKLVQDSFINSSLTPEEKQQELELAQQIFFEKRAGELSSLTIPELQPILGSGLREINIAKSLFLKGKLVFLLSSLRNSLIKTAFKTHWTVAKLPLMKHLRNNIGSLQDLNNCDDFDALDKVASIAESIAVPCAAIARHAAEREQEEAFIKFFSSLSLKYLHSDLFNQLLTTFSNMPQRDYLPILHAVASSNDSIIYKNKEKSLKLLSFISRLNAHGFTTQAIANFCEQYNKYPPTPLDAYDAFVDQLLQVYDKDSNDPLVHLLLEKKQFTLEQIIKISADTVDINEHREKLALYYEALRKNNKLNVFLQKADALDKSIKTKILVILAISFSTRRPNDPEINPSDIISLLEKLTPEQLDSLHAQYKTTPISLNCLHNALKNFNPATSFSELLKAVEKAPFGPRNFDQQFSCSEVERVVNSLIDLVNNSSPSYQYRKQLMEAFLLVNEMGRSLGVFNGKPAKDLTNQEIKDFLAEFKSSEKYNPTQKKLLALALMREAMYRSTGEFPYSTQILSIIDCMLHKGDMISNIDTGQGKSLIDVMKSAVLWLDNDRVEITTSSLMDAKRDIENYSAFLSLLNIPFSSKPIRSSTLFGDFCPNGINFSTFSQLRLFISRTIACDYNLETPNNKVSLVLNESDFSLLDDRSVKRFASSEGINIARKHPWIYEAVNDYVGKGYFTDDTTSQETDIRRLRSHLKTQGRTLGKSIGIIDQIDNDILLGWIESAIIVNYKFAEDYDYVTMTVSEDKKHFEAKVLMNDGRYSHDSVFGKGAHQLLHSNLNKQKKYKQDKTDGKPFEIKAENKTIISLDNRSLVHYYQEKNGVIWGSSGTVGSRAEIEELHKKYGFQFSKIAPHQTKQVHEKSLVILTNKEKQYARLAKEISAKISGNYKLPTLVFCENIEKTKELYNYLVEKFGKDKLQLFTGLEDEDEVKTKAATPGMFTITTAAIGRNTDILYDRQVGLDVWHTHISSTRLDNQKSGRTGRQGSPGGIFYYLNQEDQHINNKADIEKLRTELDDLGRQEREYNEELFLVLGHFLSYVDKIPSKLFTVMPKTEFFRRKWSTFSEAVENNYREQKLNNEYERNNFVQSVHQKFIQLIQEAVPNYNYGQIQPFTEVTHKRQSYNSYQQKIHINDCTPPVTIAYELLHLNKQADGEIIDTDKAKIRQELQALFSSTQKTNDWSKHAQFFRFLHESPATQKSLRGIYQEFLEEFIATQSKNSQNRSWFSRSKSLNQITDDGNYLCLFRALASIDHEKPIVDSKVITTLMADLIEDYLQNCWFISPKKRNAATTLKDNLLKANGNLQVAVNCLMQAQLTIADNDLELNRRRFIPVNFFRPQVGSRLQSTISRALTTAASLGVQTDTSQLVAGVSLRLRTVLQDKCPITNESPTLDEALIIAGEPKGTDRANARVLAKALEKTLRMNQSLQMDRLTRNPINPAAVASEDEQLHEGQLIITKGL